MTTPALAPWVKRISADVVDFILTTVVPTIVAGMVVGGGPDPNSNAYALAGWIGLVVFIVLNEIALPARSGCSAAKAMASLRICRADTFGPPSTRQLAVRAAVRWGVPFIALTFIPVALVIDTATLLWLATPVVLIASAVKSPQRRGLHDRLAGTIVVLKG